MSENNKQPAEQTTKKTTKKKINKKPSATSSIIVAVCISLAVLIAIFGGIIIYFIFNKGENPNAENLSEFHEISTNEKGETFAKVTDDEGNEIYVKIEAKEQVNVLIIGKDRWAFNTDVMIIASYNMEDQSVTMMQIPRDTYINNTKANALLASFYNTALRTEKNTDEALKTACNNLKECLSDAFGFPINYYVMMDLNGFVDIVNVIGGSKGGIEIDVPYRMYYNDPEQNLHIDLKPGKQILDGNKAEQFVRFRSAYIEGDIGRVDAQKIFISACLAQVKKNFNITTIVGVAESVMKHVITDIPLENLLYYAKEALAVDLDKMVMITLPGIQDNSTGTWYYIVSRPSTIKIVNKYFNPHTVDIDAERFDPDGSFYDRSGSAMYSIYLTDHDKQEYSADSPEDIYIYHTGGSYSGGGSSSGTSTSTRPSATSAVVSTAKPSSSVTVTTVESDDLVSEEPEETIDSVTFDTDDTREPIGYENDNIESSVEVTEAEPAVTATAEETIETAAPIE